MNNKVLIAYASKHGSTAETAEKIGQILSEHGLSVEVLPADRIKDLSQYNAVVLGSAVYIGFWRKAAVKFLKAYEEPLSKLPVWIFSLGPIGSGDPMKLTEGWCFPEKLRPVIEHIKPISATCFGGKVETKNLNFFEKWIMDKVKAPNGDFRNWETITSWSVSISDVLSSKQ